MSIGIGSGSWQRQIAVVLDLAQQQRGLFTQSQTLDLGLSRQLAKKLCTEGGPWTREARGVYRVASAEPDPNLCVRVQWMTFDPRTSVPERLRSDTVRAIVGMRSAVHLHGLGPVPEVPEFIVPEGVWRVRPDVTSYRSRYIDTARDLTVIDDMQVTTAGRTARDMMVRAVEPDLIARFLVGSLHRGLESPEAAAEHIADTVAAGERTVLDGAVFLLKLAALIDHVPSYLRDQGMLDITWMDRLHPVAERRALTRTALVELCAAAAERGIQNEHPRISTVVTPTPARDQGPDLPAPAAAAEFVDLVEPAVLNYGDDDGCGRFGILDDDGTTVLCHECGVRLKDLSAHVARVHGIPARDYKVRHGLPLVGGLHSQATRQKQSQVALARTSKESMAELRSRQDRAQMQAASRHTARTYRAARRLRPGRELQAKGTRRDVHTCPMCAAQWCNLNVMVNRTTCSERCRRDLAARTAAERQAPARPATPASGRECVTSP